MVVVIVVFSDLMPTAAGARAPDRIALAIARPMTWVVAAFGPLAMAIQRLVRRILAFCGIRLADDQPILSAHEDLRADLPRGESRVEKPDRSLFGGMLDLRELDVSDVMVHRTKMLSVNIDEPPEDVVRVALHAPFTRLPLWRGSPENIVGMLHVKDIVRALQAVGGDPAQVEIRALATEPWFVPDTTPVYEQLREFRKRKTRYAIVVDEYGVVMGHVTLEDILDEILGDIGDARDVDVPGVRPQSDGSVDVEGGVPIRDLNRAMNWSLPDAEATTIAGLVIHESRTIPEAGQSFTFHGFRFRVLRRNRNRITALRITPLQPERTPETAKAR
jgi:Mg2+/Co2+ transporter CorB